GTATPGKIFGASLVDLMSTQRRTYPELRIPLFLHSGFKFIIQYGMQIEGIFRIAGAKERVKLLQTQLDRGEQIEFVEGKLDPVDLADLIKIYFRELPDCLMQVEKYDQFLGVLNSSERQEQVDKLREITSDMRPDNQNLLRELVCFLGKVAMNSTFNKMTAENLAVVFGPNLLWKGGKAVSTNDMMELMAGAGKIKLLITLMLEEQTHIYGDDINDAVSTSTGDMQVAFNYKIGGYRKTCQAVSIMNGSSSGDAKLVWTVDSGGTVRIYNADTYATIREFDVLVPNSGARIFSMIIVKDQAWISSSSGISVWNKDSVRDETGGRFPGLHTSLTAVYSHGELRIWAGSEQKITIISTSTSEVVQTIDLPGQFIVSLTEIFGDSDQVWAGANNGLINIFNKTTGELINQLKTPASRNISCLLCHAYMEESMVWAGSEDKTIFIIDPRTTQIVNSITHPEMLMIHSLKSIANSIWSCSRDSSIRIWDPRSNECKGVLDQYHTDAVTDGVFTYNNKNQRWEFWSASYDKSICIWTVKSEFLFPPPPSL
ncbi:hypothetical protein SAMD00019534_016310, partial [Acytostelium subglobosum LB1]|uniref:hypothetical protein n=1 Tax=Acytostelium subglobosum LB1 TaxID=1410327 RepID=UPI000644ECB2